MAKIFPDPVRLMRDGTSQAGRVQAALDPEYVVVDERSVADLMAFAREYAKELRYFDDGNRAAGVWSEFLAPDISLDEVAAFVADPSSLAADKALRLSRPHLVLFLSFIELLRHPREQLSDLTRRHLEFYYQEILRMSRKAARPDHVHVLLRPAAGVDRLRLPAGTELRAGKDSAGKERVYRTDREIVVSRAQIGRLSSIHVDRQLTGVREARELHGGSAQEAFMAMLEIALGDPRPGDPLPAYKDKEVDHAFLLELKGVVDFAASDLYMELYDLRSMMELVRRRDQVTDNDGDQWQRINHYLETAGRTRTGDAGWTLDPTDPRDFDGNLVKAMGNEPDYGELPLVDTIYDLYEQRNRDDARTFIRDELYFSNHDDFVAMMQIKIRIDNEWHEINRILEKAGQRKRQNPSYELVPGDITDFTANLHAALDTPGHALDFSSLAGIKDIHGYYAAILDIDSYFHMWSKDFAYIMSVAGEPEATKGQWNHVYKIVEDAHAEKVYSARRDRLKKTREEQGFEAMLRRALGRGAGEDATVSDLREYVKDEGDQAFLEEKAKKDAAGAQISEKDWQRVYRIVELAQRQREQLAKPVAQKEEWLNLHAFEDATTAIVTSAGQAQGAQLGWKTFGRQPAVAGPPAAADANSGADVVAGVDAGQAPAENLGWAVSSPLLMLREGSRKIDITLGFRSEEFDAAAIDALLANEPFKVEVSTDKGWLALPVKTAKTGDYKELSHVSRQLGEPLGALQFALTLEPGDASLVSPPVDDAGAGMTGPWPVLRLMLRQIWDDKRKKYVTHYQDFKDLALAAVHLNVSVIDLCPSHIRNDGTILDSKKPFEPFGSGPATGARFLASDPELMVKQLDQVNFRIQWMGLPKSLNTHYNNYDISGPFSVDISLVDNHLPISVKKGAELFANLDAASTSQIEVSSISAIVDKAHRLYGRFLDASAYADPDILTWPRYLQWELGSPDFQHQAYPAVSSAKAMDMAAAIANRSVNPNLPEIKADTYKVNPPYTPKLKSLRLDYESSVEVLAAAPGAGAGADQLFHIHPFGAGALRPAASETSVRFLPQYDHEGELYIGIDRAAPPQNLAILMQMAAGSADPDVAPVPVEWSWLSGDQWIRLQGGDILSDTTRGLINSGIIEFSLAPAAPNTILPKNLYWIRAAIPYHPNSVCDTIAIHTQAVAATFVDRDNAAGHYAQPLAEESIKGPIMRTPGLAAVEQPYTSQGGKPAERASDFYTRVSERLRHKQRALTIWDYERLVLERFSAVYKAKCLPAGAPGAEPGKVVIIVIPDIRDQSLANPFEPKAPASLLADITEYLADKCPPHAVVEARNAYYVPVRVRVGVRFQPGRDESFYKKLLNEEINQFLSPWAYKKGQDITIGGKIYANSIVNFIDEREYVDYVASIKLFSSEDGGRNYKLARPEGSSGYFVTTGRPDGVLVAAPTHDIDIITDIGYQENLFTGINYMKIDLDFIVG